MSKSNRGFDHRCAAAIALYRLHTNSKNSFYVPAPSCDGRAHCVRLPPGVDTSNDGKRVSATPHVVHLKEIKLPASTSVTGLLSPYTPTHLFGFIQLAGLGNPEGADASMVARWCAPLHKCHDKGSAVVDIKPSRYRGQPPNYRSAVPPPLAALSHKNIASSPSAVRPPPTSIRRSA